MPNLNPIVRVKAFHTTRHNSTYEDPVTGVLEGTSISHVAFDVIVEDTAANRALYSQYLNNPNIPHSSIIDPATKKKMLTMYISFWPKTEIMSPISTPSVFYDYDHDSMISGMGSPMTYSPRFTRYLHPVQETLAPKLPILNKLFGYTVTMPPAIIFHKTRLQGIINTRFEAKTQTERDALFADAVAKIDGYSTRYIAWFEALIKQQNAGHNLFNSSAKINRLAQATKAAQDELLNYTHQLEQDLKAILNTDQDISDDDLLQAMYEFVTFGKEETDSIDIEFIEGLELGELLTHICELANNPDKYQYNLISYNCATIILEAFQKAARNCSNAELRVCFDYPWYVKYLGFPVSPAMVMQQMALAEQILRNSKLEVEDEFSEIDLEEMLATVPLKRKMQLTKQPAAVTKHYDRLVEANDKQEYTAKSYKRFVCF